MISGSRSQLPLFLVVAADVAPPAERPSPEVEVVATPVMTAPVVTDRNAYQLVEGHFRPEATMVSSFTGPKDQTVYLMNCNGALSAGLQRKVGNAREEAWTAETNSGLSVISREHRPLSSGTYRMAWYVVYTSFDRDARPFGEELPLGQRVSAPFTIEVSESPS